MARLYLLEGLQGRIQSLPLPAPSGCQLSCTCGHITPISALLFRSSSPRLLLSVSSTGSHTCGHRPTLIIQGCCFISKSLIFFFFGSFCLFRAAPTAHRGSQARGPIRAVAAGLRHSHSHAGSEPHLQPTPQLTATPDPLSEARDRTCILMDASQFR